MLQDAWKYIAQRKVLFIIVVLILVITPIIIKVIDSYTTIELARLSNPAASVVPDDVTAVYAGAGGRVEKETKITRARKANEANY